MADKPKQLKRFPAHAELHLLTPEEIADMRREAKETRAYYQKAFAHLRPKAVSKS